MVDYTITTDMFAELPLDLSYDEEYEFVDRLADTLYDDPQLQGPAISFRFRPDGVEVGMTVTVAAEMSGIAWGVALSALTHALMELVEPDALHTLSSRVHECPLHTCTDPSH